MFAADWKNIYNATKPFENYTIDITDKLESNVRNSLATGLEWTAHYSRC